MLREQLRHGHLVSGEPLTITDLADDLGLSATPVREALSRLAGEGLIEDRRGRGYFAPRLDVSDLAELYGLRRLYLAEALQSDQDASPLPAPATLDLAIPVGEQLGQALDWVAARGGNRALFDAYRQVNEKLAPALRVEGRVFDLAEELAEFRARQDDRNDLRVAIDRFHDSRRQRASELMRVMRAGANIASL
jgi:DNA-binding Lrp family transcriptional regulator